MNSHSILQLYCMEIKRSTEEIQMYAACNKTGTCFSKVPAINRPGKLLFTFKIDFSKLWKITWLSDLLTRQNKLVCKLGYPLFDFGPWKITGTFEKRVPGRLSCLLLKLNIFSWKIYTSGYISNHFPKKALLNNVSIFLTKLVKNGKLDLLKWND